MKAAAVRAQDRLGGVDDIGREYRECMDAGRSSVLGRDLLFANSRTDDRTP